MTQRLSTETGRGSRPCCMITVGSIKGWPAPAAKPFCPSGAKRSAIEDTVASPPGFASSRISVRTSLARRSARLRGVFAD